MVPSQDSNPRPVNRKSVALPIAKLDNEKVILSTYSGAAEALISASDGVSIATMSTSSSAL